MGVNQHNCMQRAAAVLSNSLFACELLVPAQQGRTEDRTADTLSEFGALSPTLYRNDTACGYRHSENAVFRRARASTDDPQHDLSAHL